MKDPMALLEDVERDWTALLGPAAGLSARRNAARFAADILRWAEGHMNRDISEPVLNAIAALEQEAEK